MDWVIKIRNNSGYNLHYDDCISYISFVEEITLFVNDIQYTWELNGLEN